MEEIFTKVPNKYPKKDENVFPLFMRDIGLLKKEKLGLMENKKGRAISDNHIKGTFEHTTKGFVVWLGETSNLTQGGAL